MKSQDSWNVENGPAAGRRAAGPVLGRGRLVATVPADARAALLKLRKTIQSAAPKATEEISYQVPTFKQNGGLVAYAAFPDHCSFFVMSTEVMRVHAAELASYAVGKGSVRFPAEKPLPATLVRKLAKPCIAENEAQRRSRRR